MKTVYDIGARIYFIYHGKLWWEGSKEEIEEARHQNQELNQFIKASHF